MKTPVLPCFSIHPPMINNGLNAISILDAKQAVWADDYNVPECISEIMKYDVMDDERPCQSRWFGYVKNGRGYIYGDWMLLGRP